MSEEEKKSGEPAPAEQSGSPSVPERVPGEIVEYYEQKETREVVEYYFQNRTLPNSRKNVSASGKVHKKKGLWIFLACAAVVAGLTLAAYFWQSPTSSGSSSSSEAEPSTKETETVSIPTYQAKSGVALSVTSNHGGVLTAQEIYQRVNPSVVTVLVDLKAGASIGTGVIFTKDGYLLTNYHVVAGGRECSVTLSDNTTLSAKYVAGDSGNDIAILKVEAKNLPVAEIGSSDDLTVGDKVYAIGNPLGVELRGTFTDGIVSAINRDVEVGDRVMTLVQTNAALNSGNSGGPLINSYGQVVGINTIKMSSAFSSIEGLGFALPTSSLQYIVNDLLKYGVVLPEPQLGVSVSLTGTTLPNGAVGIQVLEVEKNSAADLAGIRVGDVIVSADGQKTRTSEDLLRIRRRFNVGDRMKLTIYRNGNYQTVVLNLQKATN